MSSGAAEQIDGTQLKALRRAFFRISTRGPLTQPYGRGKRSFGLWGIMLMYALMGLAMGFIMTRALQPFIVYLILHGMTFAFIGMAVLVEAGQIVFNPQEGDVLAHLPVSRRTVTAAKLINLTLLALLLAGSFNLVPMFLTVKMHGVGWWAPFAHALSLGLGCLFCCGGVILVYGWLAGVVGRERFETILSWAQVGMSVFFIVGYQVLMQVMMRMVMLKPKETWWAWLLPPAWFGALDQALAGGESNAWIWGAGVAAVLVTVVVAWLGVARLAGGMEAQALVEAKQRAKSTAKTLAGSSAGIAAQGTASEPLIRPLKPWLRWWLRDPVEAAVFRMLRIYMLRDRDIRQRLYPQLSMVVIFPVIMLFNARSGRGGGMSPAFLYISFWLLATLPTTVLETLRFSQNPGGADIFRHAPVAGGGPLFEGARKAVLYTVCLPAALLMLALMMAISPDRLAVLKTGLPMLLLMPVASLLSGVLGLYIPLARAPRAGEQTSRSQGPMLIMMVVAGGVMWAIYKGMKLWSYGTVLALEVPLALGIYAVMRAMLRRPRSLYIDE